MEPMDGWEVLRRMRADERTRGVPVIVLTARALLPGEALSYMDREHGLVMKPLRIFGLQETIQRCIRERETVDAMVRDARGRGIDEGVISEYTSLRRRIHVMEEMCAVMSKISDMTGDPGDDHFLTRLHTLRERLSTDRK